MFLKRIEITGFKSFATKSVLDFDKGRHITAIVGPNGSGKSNVADAIRWVLGETSYKTVRAKKSEDVIFSGSNGKAKASYAKVSMLLDNTDKKAPIDFSEVEISRGVYRDGSSEYLIAGKKARLLDVAELLAKSGFGQSTYSVIGQGMVDSMLFYGPAERKVLFDEAAGVRQYEIKREQTLRKLEDTGGNIIRAKDILSELNPRLSTLKRQAEKAKEKDVVKADLLDKQKTYFSTIWDKLTHDEKAKRADLSRLSDEESKINEEIDALNKAFNEILGKEKVDSSETEKIQGQINELEKKKDQIRQSIYTLKTKMELTLSAPTKKELEKRIAETEALLGGVNFESKLSEKNKAEAALEAKRTEGHREKIIELNSKKEEIRQEIYTLRARMSVQSADDSLTKEEINSKINLAHAEIAEFAIEKNEAEVAKVGKEIANLEAEIEKINENISNRRGELNSLSEELKGFDFGVVGERISNVLKLQKNLLDDLSRAKNQKDIEKCIEVAQKINAQLAELSGQVSDVKEGRISGMAEVQVELNKLTEKKEQTNASIAELRSKVMSLNFEIRREGEEKDRLEREIKRLNALKPVDANEIKQIEKKITGLESQIGKIEDEITKAQAEVDSESQLRSQIMNLDFEIRRETEKRGEIEKEVERLKGMKPADEGEKGDILKEISVKDAEIAQLDKEIGELRAKINDRSAAFDAQGQRLSEIKDSLTAKQALLAEYNRSLTALKIDLARIETRKQDIKEEINYEMGSEAALADAIVVPELDEDLAKREIEKLKGKLYAIGEIDPEVETEFTEVNERVEFLSTQMDDLEKAKGDLEKLVSELDVKIKKQFESSFSLISEKFTHFFTTLFDGGTAKLELVKQKADPDDEDSGDQFGIEITAIPPGKKVQSLSALSGGERTLTSLALLFAILSVNPAPFCVLDEVDAALDESNTKRFLKIVEELAKSTQFIFITHNRETMKPASMIYGVTMDESHASKLLSIKLEEAEEVVKK